LKNFSEYDDILKNLGINIVFSNEENQGADVVHALSYTEGEVICFHDDDDIWVPRKLEKLRRHLRKKA